MTARRSDDRYRQLARLAALAADALDRGAVIDAAPILRRCSGALVELARTTVAPDACPQCRGPIVQPATGRRREWCSDRCRRAAHATKRGRKRTVGS